MKHIFIVTGPSGVGKTYLSNYLGKHYPGEFETLNIVTTRKPRKLAHEGDRDFLTLDEFNTQKKAGAFFASGLYNGNYYGFPFVPDNPKKHVLFNIWPALVPEFAKIKNVVLIALTVDSTGEQLLAKRLGDRYATQPNTLEKRMSVVKNDIDEIIKNTMLISDHGKIFTVTSDKTIHDEVIPFMLQKLQS